MNKLATKIDAAELTDDWVRHKKLSALRDKLKSYQPPEEEDEEAEEEEQDTTQEEESEKWDVRQDREVFTVGGCGVLARAVLEAFPKSAKPVIWYDKEGAARHAAVLYDGRLWHLGSREEGYTVVDRAELDRVIADEFEIPYFVDEDAAVHRAKQLASEWMAEMEQ